MSGPSVVALVVNITTLKTKKLKWANPPTCIPKFALYISRPFLHVDHCVNSVNINFTLNLTQGVFIDRIYRINHTETWNFNAPTLVTSPSHKITPYIFWQCWPPGDPMILCTKHGSSITGKSFIVCVMSLSGYEDTCDLKSLNHDAFSVHGRQLRVCSHCTV